MRPRHHALAAGLLLGLLHPAAHAQSDPAAALLQQGRYWLEHKNPARSQDAWKKLLQIDPNNIDALYGMGAAELELKRPAQAQAYLATMKKVAPQALPTLLLEQDIWLRSGNNPALLENARLLAGSQELDAAVAEYRKLLSGRVPQGDLALEYYGFLGYTDKGWDEAHAGLRRLARERPGDATVEVALAKQQVRGEATRKEGIRRLEKLSRRADVGGEATEAWRSVLSWIGPPSPEYVGFFQTYLKANPDDEDIRQQLGRRTSATGGGGAAQDPLALRTQEGLRALEKGDYADAENALQQVLKQRPAAPDALGGMGILRMREGNYAEAMVLLGKAAQKAPGWGKALNGARYLQLVERGNAERSSGNRERALGLFAQAVELDSTSALAQVALADLQADGGELAMAAAGYRKVLQAHPENADAWRGLIATSAESGDADEADRLLAQLPAGIRGQAGELARIRAARAAGAGRAASRRGDEAEAARAWAEAAANDPGNSWYRLSLAQSQLRSGQGEQASATVRGLLEEDPQNAEALYVNAMFAAQKQDWSQAEAILERIPQDQRASHVLALQKRARVNRQVAQALRLAAQERQPQALAQLQRLETQVAEEDDLAGVIAFAYADVGAPERGLALLRARLQQGDGSALRLQYAGMLLKTERDAEFAEVMDQVGAQRLDSGQLANYRELRRLERIRKADALRLEGDLAAAERMLEPALAQSPEDPLALAALARLHVSAGRKREAMAVYAPLLQREPRNLDLLLGAAGIAGQAGEQAQARSLADTAVSIAPDNPAVLREAGRIYRAQGKERQAMKLYAAAVEAGARSDAAAEVAKVKDAADELAQIRRDRSPQASAGMFVRQRNGSDGSSAMTDLQLPVEARFALGNGRAVVRATPTSLDAGSFADGTYAASTFGGGPVVATAGAAAVKPGNNQRASGTGFSVGYELGGFKADAGITPGNFLFDTGVGGVAYEGSFGTGKQSWYSLALERRQVTDSLLSWSGARDSRSGDAWGGVVRSGGVLTVGRDFGGFSGYAYAGHDWFKGHQVARNQRDQLGAGLNFPAISSDSRLLEIGVAFSGLAYDNNQNHFTYGHGGYFSPERYLWLGVPVSWAQRGDRWSYALRGSVGVQNIRQDAADYFPTDSVRQQAAMQWLASDAAADAGLGGAPVYAAASSTGIAYGLEAAAEYRLSDRTTLGGSFNIDNSSDYEQWKVGIYLRYRPQPQSSQLALPIVPYRSPYAQ